MPTAGTKRPSLTIDDPRSVIHQLVTRLNNAYELKHGKLIKVAALFNCPRSTISRIWSRASIKVINGNDHDIVAACREGGWSIEVVCQPPNSPDLNILDLGFFRAVQTLQQRQNC